MRPASRAIGLPTMTKRSEPMDKPPRAAAPQRCRTRSRCEFALVFTFPKSGDFGDKIVPDDAVPARLSRRMTGV